MTATRPSCFCNARRIAAVLAAIVSATAPLAAVSETPAGTAVVGVGSTVQPPATRNEDSTPRTFVLPVSPAIVLRQEAATRSEARSANAIIQAQARLAAAGYEVWPIDGTLNAKTMAALFRYQTVNRLPATGRLDRVTLQALGIE